MEEKTVIRAYIKCHTGVDIDEKQIYNDLYDINRPQSISLRTIFRWAKALKAKTLSFKMMPALKDVNTSVTKTNITAVKAVVEKNSRLSVKDTASSTGISKDILQTILEKYLKKDFC